MNEATETAKSDDPAGRMEALVSRDREVWRAALTLAHNICVQESNRHNDNDDSAEAEATLECARRIRGWLAPNDRQLIEMLDEAGV